MMTKFGEKIFIYFTTYVCNTHTQKKYDYNLKQNKTKTENIGCEVETRSMVKLRWLMFHFWLKISKLWSFRQQASKELEVWSGQGCAWVPSYRATWLCNLGPMHPSTHYFDWKFQTLELQTPGSKELEIWSGQGCGSITLLWALERSILGTVFLYTGSHPDYSPTASIESQNDSKDASIFIKSYLQKYNGLTHLRSRSTVRYTVS